jgi:hypothetical protein
VGTLAAIAGLSLAAGLAVQPGISAPVRAAGTASPLHRSHPLITAPSLSGGTESTLRELGWSSTNWSGYILPGAPEAYIAITGCWNVPAVTAAAGEPTYSSAWIGIDGVNDNDLIQTGTEQDWSGGSAQYSAWWEILPADPTATPFTMTIHAGDAVCAAITQGPGGNWTISLTDETTHAISSTSQAYAGPADSAEWIMERPVLCDNPSCSLNHLSTLADYGQTTFLPDSLNGANPNFVAGDGGSMEECNPACAYVSIPSDPAAGGNGFTLTYASPPSATVYTPLQPYRICDTRSVAVTGYGTECSGHPIGQGGTIYPQITGVSDPEGQWVPDDALSVVLNVTAIGGSAATYVTVFPAGAAPPNASNLNVTAGLNQANLVVVSLGAGGLVGIYNSAGTINVAVDVEGYFAAPTVSSSIPGLFHPIPPLRICDTRSTAVTGYSTECSGDALGQGQWEKVVVSGCPTGDPSCTASVPTSDAASVALNLTGVTGTASTFLSVVPPSGSDQCPTSAPGFSNLNINAGTNLPNRVIVPLGPDQDVCVYNSAGTINFILDVNGWFGNGSESSTGAHFYAISPLRICDTRPTSVTGYGTECSGDTLGQGATLTIPVAGVDGLPSTGGSSPPVALIANVTAVSGTANTYFTLYPSDVVQPNASDLNVGPGQITPNLVVVQLATTGGDAGDVNLFNASGSINAILDVSGWFA